MNSELIEQGFQLCSVHLVKYPDCNATENLFGGRLLAWIDESAAIYAGEIMSEPRIVTAHFGGLDFEKPTELRKIVRIYSKVLKEGNTSLRVKVVVTKCAMGSFEEETVASNEIVFVAVDETGKPKVWDKNTNN
jgi:acyl-CoA hydrolase